MGGRGASSGYSIDKNGNPRAKYGTQYHALFESDNIKFVAKNARQSETLMETMTPGRIYVETGGKDLLRIVMFDAENKRNRVIERDKRTGKWHVHKGYFHAEKGKSDHEPMTKADKIIVEKVKRMWYNFHSRA